MLAGILVAGLAPPARAARVRALPVVMQDDAEFLFSSDARVKEALASASSRGVNIIRATASWDLIAPQGESRRRPGFRAYDPAAYDGGGIASLDRLVRLAPRYGLRVMLDLAFWAPQWASQGVPTRGHVSIDPHEFGLFSFAMAERFDGSYTPAGAPGPLPRVSIFTVWNEPNEIGFFGPMWRRVSGGRFVPEGPHVYRRLAIFGYGAIKAVQPDSTVLVGGLSSHGVKPEVNGNGSMPPLQFIRQMACVDKRLRPLPRVECRHFTPVPGDGFSYHPYSFDYPPNSKNVPGRTDNAPIGELGKLTRLLDRLVALHRLAPGMRRVWITEFGYETNPPDPGARYGLQDQVDFLPWAEYIAAQNPDIVTFSQFELRDPELLRGAPPKANGFHTGLEFPDGRRKPSYYAFPAWLHAERHRGGQVLLFGHVRRRGTVQSVTIEWRSTPGRAWHLTGSAARTGATIARDFAPQPGGVFLRWARAPSGKRAQFRFLYQIDGVSRTTLPTDVVNP